MGKAFSLISSNKVLGIAVDTIAEILRDQYVIQTLFARKMTRKHTLSMVM